MSGGRGRDIGASVRARLLELARHRGIPFELVLNRYAIERLLYRLACSARRDEFVLKGATLLQIWSSAPYRPTRDVDLLGFGSPELDDVAAKIRELCVVPVPDDGITFDAATVEATRIKDDDEYEGVRVRLQASLAAARIPVQIDVGFGDAVTPLEHDYPVLLPGSPTPHLRIYPREAVVAEKAQAMVDLGLANSRMKDFYDVDHLARHFDFDGAALLDAVRATFGRRHTPIPEGPPTALTSTFAEAADKQRQWHAFLARSGIAATPLPEVVERIAALVLPIFDASRGTRELDTWRAGGPWSERR